MDAPVGVSLRGLEGENCDSTAPHATAQRLMVARLGFSGRQLL